MKKTFRSILTMLLVIVMLFGIAAPTVSYAATIVTPDGEVEVPIYTDKTGEIDTGWCVVEHEDDNLTITLYPNVDAFLDVSKQQIKDIANAIVDAAWLIFIGQLKLDIRDAEGFDIPNEDIIHHITEVFVDGEQVFGPFGENGDNVLKADALKDLLLDLPRPNEIAEMTDDEMKLGYNVVINTDYGAYPINLSLVVGGGHDKLRRVAQILSDYVDFSVAPDGTFKLDVTVPAKFHTAVLKACKTDLISDELKLKIFKACDKSVDDIEVFYNNFTFNELIELLEAVNFEGILDADFVKKYVDLSGYTNEEIIAKVKEYEYYITKAKNYAARLFKLLPERFGEKTLMDLYDGNGEFSYVGTHTVNIEDVLTELSAKYGPLAASFVDQDTVTASVDVKVTLPKINSVTYVVNGEVASEGFLPAGIEYEYIKFFAPVTEVDGMKVIAWVDENGNVVSEMPNHDIVLTAVIDKEYEVTISGNVDKVYDGVVSSGLVVGGSTTATYTYEWYKVDPNGDVKLDIVTDSINFVNAADSGEYYCVVTITEGLITKTVTTEKITVNIAKAVISASEVNWNYTTPFTYDGNEKVVSAFGIDNVEFVYEGNVATNAGKYTAKITAVNPTANFDSANYELDPAIVGLTCAWEITPKTVDVSGAAWDYSGTAFEHDGNAHGVALVPGSYPTEGVTLTYGGTTTATAVGTYTATATFTAVDGNYVVSGSVADLEWAIVSTLIKVDVSALTWNYTAPFTYTGSEFKVELKNLPEGVEVSYTGNTATAVGKYTATATVTAKAGYEVVGTVSDCAWEIVAQKVDVSNLTWNYTAPFTYTGNEFKVELNSIPAGVEVVYAGNIATAAGKYTATATVTAKAGYEVVGTVSNCAWEIGKQAIDISTIIWSTETTFTYNGSEQGITLGVPAELLALINVTVSGEKATNAGNYTAQATVTAKDADNYTITGTVADQAWSIAKKVIDLSGVTWADVNFVYDGTAKYATITLPSGASALVKIEYEYYANDEKIDAPTNAGNYVAKVVSIALNDTDPTAANYTITLPDEIANYEYTIAKADYVLSGVTFGDKVVNFDGNKHGLAIEGTLPEFITVTYSANEFYYIGSYTVTASFTVNNPNYNDNLESMTATLTIAFVAKTEHVYADSEGNVIVKVNSTKVPADHEFVVNDNSHIYTNVTLADGQNGVVLVAYDIYFAKEDTHQPISDNFVVSLKLPSSYNAANSLRVVYISESGEIEEIEATVEDGFVVFNTTHFSTYAIVSVEPAPTPAPERNLTWLWILLAVIIVALLVVIILLLLKRRKDDDGEPTEEPVPVTEPEPETEPAEEATEEVVEEEPVVEEPAEEPVVIEPVVIDIPAEPEIPADLEPAEEPETVVEEPAPAPAPVPTVTVVPLGEEDEDGVRSAIVDGEVVYVRYRSSFESRLIQSDNEIQDYYTVIKNTLLSYKGVKARSSWNFESFNKGRVQCAKLNVKGRALLVYLGLDPNEYNNNKYHFTDASDKPKFEKVPMLLKVKSDRSLKYVLELIEEMMNKLEIPQVDMPGVDYHMPYETTDALAKRGLVKVILPPGMTLDENSNIVKVNVGELLDGYDAKDETETVAPATEPVVEAPVVEEPVVEEPVVVEAPVVEEPVHVDAATADELLTDEEAEAKIEVIHTDVKRTGKLVEINLDVICENFEDDEIVNLEALKAKRLVNKSAGRVKVLARGTMTKRLTVMASKFSLQAVKMITLAGGVAEIED